MAEINLALFPDLNADLQRLSDGQREDADAALAAAQERLQRQGEAMAELRMQVRVVLQCAGLGPHGAFTPFSAPVVGRWVA